MKEHLEEEVNRLFEEEVAKGFNSNDYLKLFRHIKENQLFYRTYFKLGYDNNYRIKLYDTHQAERHFDNQYIDYHIEFFKCGLNAVIKNGLPKVVWNLLKRCMRSFKVNIGVALEDIADMETSL